ncbi:hypothetical protein IU459_27190 [Nocardia amamiensis]|uniref:Uncharacterized protein n=1 Tax=Nocardia amamiensis TaxID=404578 RepID=A0ABS0CZN3_9NOCA|nr:hypothetical protein [Nocardia amamiensis]MBF6301202.1 hypothetical protein [Nocardia amamiensis]
MVRTECGPLPHRYRVGRYGPVVLMDCRECRRPFAPDRPVPRDRLCGECRALVGALTLFDVTESDGDLPESERDQ